MSEELNDPAEIFAKMQELQRSIEESKMSLASHAAKPVPASYSGNRNIPIRGYPYLRGRGGYRGSSGPYLRGGSFAGSVGKPYRNMSLVLNNNSSNSSVSQSDADTDNKSKSTGGDQFYSKVSKGGVSLVNAKVFLPKQMRKLAKKQKRLQAKIDKMQRTKKSKIQQKLQELSIRYDYCNRAFVNGIEMALVNENIRLVPIQFIEDRDYKNNIEYDGYGYSKLGDGSYLIEGHNESDLPT